MTLWRLASRNTSWSTGITGRLWAGLLLGVVLLSLLVFAPDGSFADADGDAPARLGATDAAPGGPASFALPTLGGRQLWADRRFYAGWRIQQHVWSGHFRLLDPEDRRHAWGGEAEVAAAFAEIRSERKLAPASDHLVVLLHGWGRSRHMFDELSSALTEAGYEVARLSYPSTRQDLAQHAGDLAGLLGRLDGSKRVSFVTHSLGAMVLRRMLAEAPAFSNGITLERAVLIAPPSQGAELARRLEGFPIFDWLGGPVGRELTPVAAETLPAPSIPFMVVAGARGTAEGWNPLIPGDDDGVVGLAEARLPGALAFHVVPEIHTFIVNHPQAIAATLDFLGGTAAPLQAEDAQ